MLTSVCDVDDAKCAHCSGRMVDIDEEIVCSSYGSVRPKEVAADSTGGAVVRKARAVDYTNHSLGSFLGPMEYDRDEAPSKGFSGSSSTFKYLKTISDYSQLD